MESVFKFEQPSIFNTQKQEPGCEIPVSEAVLKARLDLGDAINPAQMRLYLDMVNSGRQTAVLGEPTYFGCKTYVVNGIGIMRDIRGKNPQNLVDNLSWWELYNNEFYLGKGYIDNVLKFTALRITELGVGCNIGILDRNRLLTHISSLSGTREEILDIINK